MPALMPALTRSSLCSLLFLPLHRLFAAVLFCALAACQSDGTGGTDQGSEALAAEEGSSVEACTPQTVETEACRTLQRQGLLMNSLGKHQEAEALYRHILQQREAAYGPDDPASGELLINLALEVSNQRRFEEAALIFDRAEPIAQNPSHPLQYPLLLTYKAINESNRGNYQEAYKLAEQATILRRDILKVEANRFNESNQSILAALSGGLSALAHGLLVKAGAAFQIALIDPSQNDLMLADARISAGTAHEVLQALPNTPSWWLAQTEELMALIQARQGEYDPAEIRARFAADTKHRAFGERRPAAITFLNLGRVLYDKGDQEEALGVMRRALDIVRNPESDGRGNVSFDRLSAFLAAAYAKAQREPEQRDALYREMFESAQLVREGNTARTLAATAARLASGDGATAALIRRVQDAERQRDELRLDLGREAAKPLKQRNRTRIDTLRQEFLRAQEQAKTLNAELEKAAPGYARLVSARPISVAEVAQQLQPNEALVAYALGQVNSFVFLIRADGRVMTSPLALNAPGLAAEVAELRQAFVVTASGIRPFDMQRAYKLYQILLAPVADGLEGVTHLVVAPKGALLSLPLGLLITASPPGGEAYGGAAFLAKQAGISTIPSVRGFLALRGEAKPSRAPNPFIGFGNPVFTGSADEDALASLGDQCQAENQPIPPQMIRALTPLPGTADEIREVARAMGAGSGSVHLANEVTEPRVRRQKLNQYRIVYFATHGLLPQELKCQAEPALALTPPRTPVPRFDQDGLLSASEVAMLDLDAEMVVLSACNTGGGDGSQFGGESLSGLAQSFFYAGARSMLVSHWQVDSQATVRLMTSLFSRLARRRDNKSAEALRQAQIDLLGDPRMAHPFFWGAFTLVGDGNRPETGPGRQTAARASVQ